ncbi:MAG TPA: hypothetical protein PKD90_06525, partial [Phnomibacter sp.]|nr:hypothetical protein [Phnomibacter sp.]
DTLTLLYTGPAWQSTKRMATLNVWIEDTELRQRFRLRYPIIAGEAEARIILPKDIPEGRYAMYLGLQAQFLRMYGQVLNPGYRADSIRCTLLLENAELFAGTLPIVNRNQFNLPPLLFQNKAQLFFSNHRSARPRKADLEVALQVPLDSNLAMLKDTIVMFTVGNLPQAKAATDYSFNPQAFAEGEEGSLPGVIVKGKKKSFAEEFNETYVSGLFQGMNGRILSNENGEMLGFFNVLEWLQGRVAGLQINRNGNSYSVTWRGDRTALFLDEMQVDAQALSAVPVNDIAIVKTFPPPFLGAPLGGAGGAVAVYTRRGGSLQSTSKAKFTITGYTPEEITLTQQ